jgi:hypothetical protein
MYGWSLPLHAQFQVWNVKHCYHQCIELAMMTSPYGQTGSVMTYCKSDRNMHHIRSKCDTNINTTFESNSNQIRIKFESNSNQIRIKSTIKFGSNLIQTATIIWIKFESNLNQIRIKSSQYIMMSNPSIKSNVWLHPVCDCNHLIQMEKHLSLLCKDRVVVVIVLE